MRVLLIEPPAKSDFSTEERNLFSLVARANRRLPLGLAYLGAVEQLDLVAVIKALGGLG